MAAVLVSAPGMTVSPAAKTTSALPPGNPDAIVLSRARLLASYGEPRLALSDLRQNGLTRNPGATELTAALLTELGQAASAESLLATQAPAPADPEARLRRQLVCARLLLEARRFDASLVAASLVVADSTSAYAAYLDLVAARDLIATGEADAAVARLERARARAPEALRNDVDETLIDALRARGQPDAALAVAAQAAENGLDPAADRRLLKIRFDLATEIGDSSVAMEAARELFARFRRSSESQSCALVIAGRPDPRRPETPLLLSCASVLQANGEYRALHTVLRRLDARSLTAAQSEQERLLWGEYHFMNGDYRRAIALARPTYADLALARRSMLLMARSYKRVNRNADAATVYENYARSFPNDGIAADALYSAASLYRELKREDDRIRVLDELRHSYPSTFQGWAASMERARLLDAAGAHADATAIFDQWLTRSRRTDEAALFYASRQRRAAGDASGGDALLAELRSVNPYSFYARPDLLLPAAAQAAGSAQTGELNQWLSGASAKRDEAFRRVEAVVEQQNAATPPSEAMKAIERARFFLAAGFRDWGERELDVARLRAGDNSAESLELARIFDEHAMPWRSVRLYEKARAGIPWASRKDSEDDFRYLTHPVPYPVQVVSAAQREGIAPYVLYGMMREESCFNTDVVSRAGAVGLMQLMPETARAIAKRAELPADAGDRLGDPAVNVSIGSWYAADLLRAGEGSVVWMLAAYNAGPAVANQWIQRGAGGDAAIDAVESIDYKETRGYVKRVVEASNVYHALYFDGELASTPR